MKYTDSDDPGIEEFWGELVELQEEINQEGINYEEKTSDDTTEYRWEREEGMRGDY